MCFFVSDLFFDLFLSVCLFVYAYLRACMCTCARALLFWSHLVHSFVRFVELCVSFCVCAYMCVVLGHASACCCSRIVVCIVELCVCICLCARAHVLGLCGHAFVHFRVFWSCFCFRTCSLARACIGTCTSLHIHKFCSLVYLSRREPLSVRSSGGS